MTDTTETGPDAGDGPAAARAGRKSGLDAMLLPELKRIAGGLGIRSSGLRKGALVEAIKEHQTRTTGPARSASAPQVTDSAAGSAGPGGEGRGVVAGDAARDRSADPADTSGTSGSTVDEGGGEQISVNRRARRASVPDRRPQESGRSTSGADAPAAGAAGGSAAGGAQDADREDAPDRSEHPGRSDRSAPSERGQGEGRHGGEGEKTPKRGRRGEQDRQVAQDPTDAGQGGGTDGRQRHTGDRDESGSGDQSASGDDRRGGGSGGRDQDRQNRDDRQNGNDRAGNDAGRGTKRGGEGRDADRRNGDSSDRDGDSSNDRNGHANDRNGGDRNGGDRNSGDRNGAGGNADDRNASDRNGGGNAHDRNASDRNGHDQSGSDRAGSGSGNDRAGSGNVSGGGNDRQDDDEDGGSRRNRRRRGRDRDRQSTSGGPTNQGGQGNDGGGHQGGQGNQGNQGGQGNQGSQGGRGTQAQDRSGQGTSGRGGRHEPDLQILEDDVLAPCAGILDLMDNYAFVRTSGYLPGADDVYVSMSLVRKFGLRRGDAVVGQVRQPREGERKEKFNPLVRIDNVNGAEPDAARSRVEFDALTPLYPSERLRLETTPANLIGRVIDVTAPIGKGQRGLVLAPSQAGKTKVLQSIATSVTANNPECHLMVVLVDERPEDVTEFQRVVKGEVVSSTFDRSPGDHTIVAELAIERAKRLVELGHDVVVLLDGLTRLARAYNLTGSGGRTLPGGVDSSALHPPKRFFGAARNIEDGGSLTILATALVGSGSRTDEVILEEFTSTANMELHLSREHADRRVFPAIDPVRSGTRREELLMGQEELAIVWKLRRALSEVAGQDALETLLTRLRASQTNLEFLTKVQKDPVVAPAVPVR